MDDTWLLELVRKGYKLNFQQNTALVVQPVGQQFHLVGDKLVAVNKANREQTREP